MEEVWKDIKGYEGKYAVSNTGHVKSLNYNRTGKEKLLRPRKDSGGYLYLGLYKGGKRKMYNVHRLVLQTFAPCDNMDKLEVNHIDENKLNNRLENLEWCDRSYNINHGTRNTRVAEKMTNGKNSIPIVQLALEGKFVKAWESSMAAERECGYSNSHINDCCKGKLKTHGGFRWMYLSEYMDNNCGIIE